MYPNTIYQGNMPSILLHPHASHENISWQDGYHKCSELLFIVLPTTLPKKQLFCVFVLHNIPHFHNYHELRTSCRIIFSSHTKYLFHKYSHTLYATRSNVLILRTPNQMAFLARKSVIIYLVMTEALQ